ncbi:MAG TPA: YcnI family protein [Iamia sp.]
MTTAHRLGLGLLGAGVLALGLAVPASAHITVDTGSVPAGGFTAVTLTVPHGCEESPTSEIAVEIPESILNASPQVVAGWEAETTITELDEPVTSSHGDEVTERISEVTWTAEAGNELPAHFRQVFTIGFQAPEEVGERLYFKIVQTCTEGETAWIEETEDGAEEPEHPAPFVDVVAAEEDGHGAAEETTTTAAAGVPDQPVAASTDADDGGSDGLAIGGLVLGALGLAAGGAALVRTRSTD